MKYLLCFILLVIGFGVSGPPLYYSHALPLIPAVMSGAAFSFCFYLLDPTQFLSFMAEVRKSATCYFKRGES
jgi:hypothetical protein